jgi:hypothetical protein
MASAKCSVKAFSYFAFGELPEAEAALEWAAARIPASPSEGTKENAGDGGDDGDDGGDDDVDDLPDGFK